MAQSHYGGEGERGKLQIVFGLICTAEGCPVAVEVFEGIVGDPSTMQNQVNKVKQRFALEHVVRVGDRGLITRRASSRPSNRPVSTSSPPCGCRRSAAWPRPGPFSFPRSTSAVSPRSARADYPEQRLVVCRNSLLADERARKRRELLDATERDLLDVQTRLRRAGRPLRGKDKIALAVGAVINHDKMARHFALTIIDEDLTFERKRDQIDAAHP